MRWDVFSLFLPRKFILFVCLSRRAFHWRTKFSSTTAITTWHRIRKQAPSGIAHGNTGKYTTHVYCKLRKNASKVTLANVHMRRDRPRAPRKVVMVKEFTTARWRRQWVSASDLITRIVRITSVKRVARPWGGATTSPTFHPKNDRTQNHIIPPDVASSLS